MLEATIKYQNGVRFEAAAGAHTVVCDQPVSNSGTDAGMTPPEFLLVSLGTCAGFYAAQYLKTRALDADGLTVRVQAEKAQGPARLGSFRIEVNVPGLTDERHKEGVMRAVKACLIHNTLANPPAIELALNTEPVPLTV
ncbi:MAG TPA: OsmC family protein [Bryobacteraceae bacterium]